MLRISKILFLILLVLAIIYFVMPPLLRPTDWNIGYGMPELVLGAGMYIFILVGGLFALIVIVGYSPFKGPGKAYPYLLLMLASALVAFTLCKTVSSNMARAKAEESMEREQSQPVERVPTK